MCHDATQGRSVLLFGDSVIDSWNKTSDKHWTSVADFLGRALSVPVLDASHPGQKIPEFNQLLQLLGQLNPHPCQAIIIELNPVILAWESDPAVKEIWKKRIQFQTIQSLPFKAIFEYAALKEYKGAGRPAWLNPKAKPIIKDSEYDNILRTCEELKVNEAIDEASLLRSFITLKKTAEQYSKHLIFL